MTAQPVKKPLNLALQGGGAKGAFTWGVLDKLLDDDRVHINAVTATSAGAVNAVLLATGLATGGRDKAKSLLHDFWKKLSEASNPFGLPDNPYNNFIAHNASLSPALMAMDTMTRFFTPAQFNPLNINPLRDLLDELVDFKSLDKHNELKLFINATNVRTGKIKVWENGEITRDTVLASACLPQLFPTVWIDDEPYWDGGFSGNPAIFPLFYQTDVDDVVIVQINPLKVDKMPDSPSDILDRMNEIAFNSTLMREMRAIAFVSKLKNEGSLSSEDARYKKVHVHMISGEEVLGQYGQKTKMLTDWDFLTVMFEEGQKEASQWLNAHHKDLSANARR